MRVALVARERKWYAAGYEAAMIELTKQQAQALDFAAE